MTSAVRFGGSEGVAKLFPDEDYQLTHNKLFGHHRMHTLEVPAAFARVVAFDGEWPANP